VRRLVIVLALLVASNPAHAEKNRKTAQILAGVATGASSALVLSGFLFASDGNPINKPLMYAGLASAAITPSIGQFYAGEYLTIGMAVRVGAAGIATFAITHETESKTCDNATMSGTTCTSFAGAGIALLGVAAIAFIGGMAYDVDDAGAAADRYNLDHGLVVTPTAMATPNGPAPGLSLAGYF
jgi:hypothetical protein